MDVSLNLRAIVSQRLIPKQDAGRVAAIEVMLNSPNCRSDLQGRSRRDQGDHEEEPQHRYADL